MTADVKGRRGRGQHKRKQKVLRKHVHDQVYTFSRVYIYGRVYTEIKKIV